MQLSFCYRKAKVLLLPRIKLLDILAIFRMCVCVCDTRDSFSPVTSTNVGISCHKLLETHYGVKFQSHSWCQSQIIELETRPPIKKCEFSSKILNGTQKRCN